jgi:Transposase DDE domain
VVCIDPHGYDAGKKIKGKKRHILVDTLGLLLHAIVHPADIQDRDGGILLLATLFGMYPFLTKLFADGGYQGPEFQKALEKAYPTSKRKSSSAPMAPKDLCCLHAAGSSSARLPGSTAVEGSPKIGRTSIEKRWLSCASLQSASCSESFVILHDVSGQTLRTL